MPKETALAKQSPDQVVLQAINETELFEALALAEGELTSTLDLEIFDESEVADFSERIRQLREQREGYDEIRKLVVAPLNAKKTEIQALFNPTLEALETLERSYKNKIGSYQVAQVTKRRELEAAAAKAVKDQNPEAMRTALVKADATGPAKVKGTGTKLAWKVKRVAVDMLPDEYKVSVPDMTKLAAIAAATSETEEPPVIPGVVYELSAVVSVKGKSGMLESSDA